MHFGFHLQFLLKTHWRKDLVSYIKNNNDLLLFKLPSFSFPQLWIHSASIQFNQHLIKLQCISYMMRFIMLIKFLLGDHVWPGHSSCLTSLHLLHLPKLFVFSGTNPSHYLPVAAFLLPPFYSYLTLNPPNKSLKTT